MRECLEFGGYRHYGIEYIPKQYLRIIRQVKVGGKIYSIIGTARTINEVGGFFQKSFVKVIKDWKVADDDTIRMIERNKAERSAFTEITPEIDRYCGEECRLLAATMERLRTRLIEGTRQVKRRFPKQFPDISLVPEAWRGAGFVAAKLLNSTGTPKAEDLPALPRKMENMVIEAYFGGRFEISRTGYIPGPIYEYDICSAYPAAMPLLPCPLHTKWRKVSEPAPGTLYIADLTFEHPAHKRWCGLPFRTKHGHLYWPANGSGVYWSVEIEAAQKLLNANMTFRQIWQAEKRYDCTPYSWVEPLYEFRKSLGKGIEGFPIKLGLNALYGKQAQRKGARTYHNLVHAGLITAITRAKLSSAIALDPEAVVMLATDGVYSTKPLRGLEIGDRLGAWEHGKEQIHPDMFIVQPGLYWFPKEKSSDRSHKTRGIPKSIVQQNAPAFLAAWEEYCLDCIEPMQRTFFTSLPPVPPQFNVPVPINTFIGLRLALHRNKPSLAGRWHNDEKKMSFDWSLKRARGELNGTFVEHWPIEGDVNARSICYDEKLLTEIAERNLEMEAMPDFVQIVDNE